MPVHNTPPWKLLSCILALGAFSGNAFASSSYEGSVSMQGSILNTACAIATSNSEQTIEMNVITVDQILRNGKGPEQPFSLNLIHCDIANRPQETLMFHITFEGATDSGLFSLSGAGGIGLQIKDARGNIAEPGKQLPDQALSTHEQRLDFTLRLMRNHHELRAGEYDAILRFNVDYF